jgi:hypothetical protein
LFNSDDPPVVGEHHCAKHRRGHNLHHIHVATSEQDVVVEQSVDNFNFNEDSFSPEFNGWNILEESLRRGGSFIVRPQSNGRWYELRRANFLPYSFGHDGCGCTFINNVVVNCDVLDFKWYLESDQSRETRFPTIEIKGDELSINRVECLQSGN